MTALVTLLLSLAGFAALAASMAKHHRDLFGATPGHPRMLAVRGGGWLLLAASLALPIAWQGALVGMVLWLGMATVAALAVAMALTYAVRRGDER